MQFTKTKIKTFLYKEKIKKHIYFFNITALLIFSLLLLITITIFKNDLKINKTKANYFSYSLQAKKNDLEAIKQNRQNYLNKIVKKQAKIKPKKAFKVKTDKVQAKIKTIAHNSNKQVKRVLHLWINKKDRRQKLLQYAYKKSWYDKDMILTFTAENYRWTTTRKSNIIWKNGYRDYWICQVNAWYHPEILRWKGYKYPDNRYFSKWFLNPYKQIDYCIKLYKNWTKFYGYNVRYKVKNSIKFY